MVHYSVFTRGHKLNIRNTNIRMPILSQFLQGKAIKHAIKAAFNTNSTQYQYSELTTRTCCLPITKWLACLSMMSAVVENSLQKTLEVT